MYKPRQWYLMNKNRFLPMIVIAIVCLFILLITVFLFKRVSITDSELFSEAITKTLACNSYRYTVDVKQNGRDTITMVEGERAGPNRVRLKGSMQKSQMEFIYIDEITYMKDPWSEQWFTLKGNSLMQSELFMAEFNPMGLLQFKDIPEFNNLGSEKIDGIETVVLEITPGISNPLLEVKYNEIRFKLWIDPDEKYIRKAEMLASVTGGKESLLVTMTFKDFNQTIIINPPEGNIVEN